jgi:hypothetical protein
MGYRFLLLSFLLLLGISCTSEKEPELDLSTIPPEIQQLENLTVIDNEPGYTISIADSQNYGEVFLSLTPPAPSMGSGPKNIVDAYGNVIRYNNTEELLQIFDENGGLVGSFGRKGRGPGEFVTVTALSVYDGTLMVYDANLTRVSLFDIESRELAKTISLPYESWSIQETSDLFPRTLTLHPDGGFLIALRAMKEDESYYFNYYRMNEEGLISSEKIVETQNKATHIGRTKMGHNAGISLPFSHRGEIAVSDQSKIYHINTSQFLISKLNTEGEVEKAFYMPFTKDPLEEQEVLGQYHPNMHPVFDDVDYPETWPALDQILVDDENRMWVSTIVDDHSIYKWHVISDEGKLLATLDWPREKEPISIRNGKIYTEFFDREGGMRVLTGYDFRMVKK